MPLRSFAVPIAPLFVLLGACIPPDPGPPASPRGSSSASPSPAPTCAPALRRVRRLSTGEYMAAVRDLVGDVPFVARFPPDPRPGGFDNDADALIVSASHADQYAHAAEQIAANAAPAACAPGEAPIGCARRFVASFGRRAFRRPLTDEEAARYLELYLRAAEGRRDSRDGHDAGIRLVVEALLQSPGFLYRTELGDRPADATGAVPLTGWERAAQLSFGLTGGPPDAALLALAESDALADPETRAAEARRLLVTPRAREHLGTFLAGWLGVADLDRVAKVVAIVPEFTSAVRADMAEEMRRFFADAVDRQGGSLAHLLGGTTSFASERLIKAVYGREATPIDGDGKVALDPTRRRGVLSLPGFLAAHASVDRTSPVDRGLFVRLRLFCHEIPSPPPGLPIQPINADDPTRTTRQKLEQHVNQAACRHCHQFIDPVGFGFESMDLIGRFRTTERNYPVDARGALTGTDVDGPFEGPAELAGRVLSSDQVRACFVGYAFQHVEGRPANPCERDGVWDRIRARGDARLDEIVVALVARAGFALRTAP